MNPQDWSTKDYQTALDFIAEHEGEAASNTILTVDNDITVILGLPLYGAGFYGIFMLAPIILFMLLAAYLLLIILNAESMEIQTQILFSGGCFFLLWALSKALQLLTATRELFPRKYFTALGVKGMASHYSRLHFPIHSKVMIAWNDVESTRVYSSLFLAGIFSGVLQVHFVEVTSRSGNILKIPFKAPADESTSVANAILDLLNRGRHTPSSRS